MVKNFLSPTLLLVAEGIKFKAMNSFDSGTLCLDSWRPRFVKSRLEFRDYVFGFVFPLLSVDFCRLVDFVLNRPRSSSFVAAYDNLPLLLFTSDGNVSSPPAREHNCAKHVELFFLSFNWTWRYSSNCPKLLFWSSQINDFRMTVKGGCTVARWSARQ